MADPVDLTRILSSAVVAAVVSGVVAIARERYILDQKADVDYRSNARKRLYEAVEPLRFQMLFAARDVADSGSRRGGSLADAVRRMIDPEASASSRVAHSSHAAS